jgi:erythronate-4-phosphate dehydrogenase
MKIVSDDHIPFLKGILEPHAEIKYLHGKDITHNAIYDADALLVRTRTRCDEALLAGSAVRFIGTATIGTDHIDTDYCRKQQITVANAPGSNAASVAQYVISSLLLYSLKHQTPLHGKSIGIVGSGHVGTQVENLCREIGMNVLRNDPPRALSEQGFVDLETIAGCDFISLHTPLTRSGDYPTLHLLDDSFFSLLQKEVVICNTARGEVIDTQALKRAVASKKIAAMIIDCWEHEPLPDLQILEQAFIATPHIAGYSSDGKANASRTIINELAAFFGFHVDSSSIEPPSLEDNCIDLNTFPENRMEHAILAAYNPENESNALKRHPELFEHFRGFYGVRREFPAFCIRHATLHEIKRLANWGFRVELVPYL